jgi:putative membrane protein
MTLLTDKEQQQVASAISDVERETDAELVTVLADASDSYAYIPLLWAGIVALLIPGTINYFTGSLGADWLLVVQWVTFIVLCLLLQFPGVRHHLIPKPVRFWRASKPSTMWKSWWTRELLQKLAMTYGKALSKPLPTGCAAAIP